MKNLFWAFALLLPVVFLAYVQAQPSAAQEKASEANNQWQPLPQRVEAPQDNPTTAAKVELGKKLYFDPRLSITGTVSCNTCHNLMEGGDDGRATSMGVHGRLGPRNAPTVWNSAFQTAQFWDARAKDLEEQSKGPLVANPEMGMPSHEVVLERIAAIPGYRVEFAQVFGKKDPITIDNVGKAIAAFERTLITPSSAYDRFAQGDNSALRPKQQRGLKLFASVGCTECHSGPAFNNWEPGIKEIALSKFPRFADDPIVSKYSLSEDLGRYTVTKDSEDKHYFKIPTLRNVTLTAPYFHNGTVDELSTAIKVMGITQLGTELSDEEIDEIVAFLTALEGEFPELTLPRLPSRPGKSILQEAQSAGEVAPIEQTDH